MTDRAASVAPRRQDGAVAGEAASSSMATRLSPLSWLRALAQGATRWSVGVPAGHESEVPARGLGFSIGGQRLVSVIGDVLEVLAPPRLTAVPGVRPWVLGVANVRGRLMPVMDLARYLGFEVSAPDGQWRVLVVEDGELYCGLLVEQSFGMLQFEATDAEPVTPVPGRPELTRFLRGGYRQSGRQWRVMDLRSLVREPAFFEVAAS